MNAIAVNIRERLYAAHLKHYGLRDAIERLVGGFGVDSIFLDETCSVFYNDPAWDQVDGVRRWVRDVRRHRPQGLRPQQISTCAKVGRTFRPKLWVSGARFARRRDRCARVAGQAVGRRAQE